MFEKSLKLTTWAIQGDEVRKEHFVHVMENESPCRVRFYVFEFLMD